MQKLSRWTGEEGRFCRGNNLCKGLYLMTQEGFRGDSCGELMVTRVEGRSAARSGKGWAFVNEGDSYQSFGRGTLPTPTSAQQQSCVSGHGEVPHVASERIKLSGGAQAPPVGFAGEPRKNDLIVPFSWFMPQF